MTPTTKVGVGAFATFLTALIVWGLKQRGVEMDAATAVAMSGVITFIVQWLVPDAPTEVVTRTAPPQ